MLPQVIKSILITEFSNILPLRLIVTGYKKHLS